MLLQPNLIAYASILREPLWRARCTDTHAKVRGIEDLAPEYDCCPSYDFCKILLHVCVHTKHGDRAYVASQSV